MKKNLLFWFAALCVAFIAAPVAAAPPPSGHAQAAGEAAECKVDLAECREDLQECRDQCPAALVPVKAFSPPKKRIVVPVCDETAGARAVDGPDGKECECPDERTRPVVSEKRRFRNFDRLTIVCALTDLSDLDALKERLASLEGVDFHDLLERITRLENGGIVTPEDLAELEQQVNDHEQRIAELERKDAEENCKKDGTNCPDAFASSPNEWSIGAFGLGVIRPGGPPSTIGVGGSVGFTGWFNPTNAFQLTGLVGYGFNRDADRVVTGAALDYVHAFSVDREHRLQLGLMGLVEPGRSGNEAAFLGPRVSYRWVPSGFFLEPSLALGGGKVMLRDAAGNRTDQLSGTAFVVVPSLTAGFSFGGSPTTSSSSSTTGGSVSTETP